MRKKIITLSLSIIIVFTSVYSIAAYTVSPATISFDGVTYSAAVGTEVVYTCYLQTDKTVENGVFSVSYPAELVNVKKVTSPSSQPKGLENKIQFNYTNGGSDNFSDEKAVAEIVFEIVRSADISFSFRIDSLNDNNGAISKNDYKLREDISFKSNTEKASYSEQGNVITADYTWSEGRIAISTGKDVEETKKRYYRTGLISTKKFNNVDITVLDTSYRYNLFFYNGNKEYLSPLQNVNPPTLNVNDTVPMPANTAYVRLEVCRSESLGAVDVKALENKSKIYFTFLYIEPPKETQYIPRTQGIYTEGRIAISTGKDVADDRNIYYTTTFLSVINANSVKAFVVDNTYRYNIFWYDSSKAYLGCEENVNPPTLNITKEYTVKSKAYYFRFEVCRKSSIDGIEDGSLIGKGKIYFGINYKTNALEPDEGSITSKQSVSGSSSKKKNTLTVTAVSKKVSAKKLKKGAVTVKALKIKKAIGKVSCKKLKGSSKRITIVKNSKKLKIKKGTKKGTYKVKVKTTADGNSKYKSKSITKTVKIKVV